MLCLKARGPAHRNRIGECRQHHRETDRHGAEALHGGEELRNEHDDGEEHEIAERDGGARPPHGCLLQDAHIEERCLGAQFGPHEGHAGGSPEGEQQQDRQARPAEPRSLDEPGHHRAEADDRKHRTGQVQPARIAPRSLGQVAPAGMGGRQKRHHGHEEHGTPVQPLQQDAAQHRADGDARTGHHRPAPDHHRAFLGREDVGDECQRSGKQGCGPEPHHGAPRDQPAHVGCEGGDERAQHEQPDPGEEHALAPVPVAQAARQHHEARDRHRIGIVDPLPVGVGAVKIAQDYRQRHIDDGNVHRADAESEIEGKLGAAMADLGGADHEAVSSPVSNGLHDSGSAGCAAFRISAACDGLTGHRGHASSRSSMGGSRRHALRLHGPAQHRLRPCPECSLRDG